MTPKPPEPADTETDSGAAISPPLPAPPGTEADEAPASDAGSHTLAVEESPPAEVGIPVPAAAATSAEPLPAAADAAAHESAVDGDTESPGDAAPADAAASPAAPKVADLSPAACAAALALQFPALFGTGVLLPVKLRIQTDIQLRAPGTFSRKALSLYLHRHTTSSAYIRALLAAPHRFDLDGQAAGEISEEHRAAAVAELDRRKALVHERRAAQRQQQRPARPAQLAQHPVATVDGVAAVASDAAPLPPAPQHRPERTAGTRPQRPDGPRRPPSADPAGGGRSGNRPEGARAGSGADRGPHSSGADAQATTRGPGPARHDDRPRSAAEGQGRRPAGLERGPRDDRGRSGRSGSSGREQPAMAQPPARADAPMASGGDPVAISARRERSALLRTFESSTLTKSNFLVLKRMTEAELDAQLTLARQERQQSPQRDEPTSRR